jgi:hypothetical protein
MSVINDTFCVATQTTPSKMMYGDKVNRVRGILTPHGEPSIRTLSFTDEVSTAHAFIMAAAEDNFQQRLQKARSLMPDFDPDTLHRAGEYVVASLPNGEKGKRWLGELGEDRFITFMCGGVAKRLMDDEFDDCITRWLALLGPEKLATLLNTTLAPRWRCLGDPNSFRSSEASLLCLKPKAIMVVQ